MTLVFVFDNMVLILVLVLVVMSWKMSHQVMLFGRPFKTVRPVLSDRYLSCLSYLSVLSCLSVTLVYCGQTVRRIKMKLGTQVGFGPGHIVLDRDPGPPPQSGTAPTQLSAHICCGQIARWIKVPLRRKVGLDPSDIVLDPGPFPKKGAEPPIFG